MESKRNQEKVGLSKRCHLSTGRTCRPLRLARRSAASSAHALIQTSSACDGETERERWPKGNEETGGGGNQKVVVGAEASPVQGLRIPPYTCSATSTSSLQWSNPYFLVCLFSPVKFRDLSAPLSLSFLLLMHVNPSDAHYMNCLVYSDGAISYLSL